MAAHQQALGLVVRRGSLGAKALRAASTGLEPSAPTLHHYSALLGPVGVKEGLSSKVGTVFGPSTSHGYDGYGGSIGMVHYRAHSSSATASPQQHVKENNNDKTKKEQDSGSRLQRLRDLLDAEDADLMSFAMGAEEGVEVSYSVSAPTPKQQKRQQQPQHQSTEYNM